MFESPSYMNSGEINEESPSYTQSIGSKIIQGEFEGTILHPTTEAKIRNGQMAGQEQFAHMPNNTAPLNYAMRSDIAPYTLNYPYADTRQEMAWGVVDNSESAKTSPFKTALATSSLIVLGAVVGEWGLQSLIAKRSDKLAKKNGLPTGMGALIGAITANAIRMAIAGQLSSGFTPALKAFGGGLLPIAIPLLLTITKQNPKANKTKLLLTLGGLGFLSVPFIIKLRSK